MGAFILFSRGLKNAIISRALIQVKTELRITWPIQTVLVTRFPKNMRPNVHTNHAAAEMGQMLRVFVGEYPSVEEVIFV